MTRAEHKEKIVNALTEAQKIAFSPLAFQALASMLDLGILKAIDTGEDLEKLNLSAYTLSVLLEAGELTGVIEKRDGKHSTTMLGQAFLYDEMTRVNFNFVKDVCYSGAEKLTDSFMKNAPCGLKELFPDAKTIYPYITKLPEKMKKSWYEFDHYYSDNCFDIMYKMISPVDKIFDIGANTGKFEKVCLKNNPAQNLTLIDLEENINFIKCDEELARCNFFAADMLSPKSTLPVMSGAVVMSQFLDCFSEEQIVFILEKIKKYSTGDIKIYILEPFIDRQKFTGAKYSLVHTSLYFTCMANGCSKMYTLDTMAKAIEKAGFKINNIFDSLGANDYTLLECIKND